MVKNIFVQIEKRLNYITNKTQKEIENKLVSIVKQDEQDYLCLSDMGRDEEGTDHNTVEFIGLFETLYNPNFKPVEFDTYRNKREFDICQLTQEICN